MKSICFLAWFLILALFNLGILGTDNTAPRILFLCAAGIVFLLFFYIRYTRIDDREGSLLGKIFLIPLILTQMLYIVTFLVYYYVVSATRGSPEDTWWNRNYQEFMDILCWIMAMPFMAVWFMLIFETRHVMKKFVGHLRWLFLAAFIFLPYYGVVVIAPYRNDPNVGIVGSYILFPLMRFIAISGSFVITVWSLWLSLLKQDPQDHLSFAWKSFLKIFSHPVEQEINQQRVGGVVGDESYVTIPPLVELSKCPEDNTSSV